MSGEQFGKTMAAVNVFARISKLIEIYSSLSVEVKVVGNNPVHKPLEGEDDLEVEFDAKVGVSDKDWKDYQQKYGELGTAADRIARDCLSTLGIPTLANTGDIAKAVEGFAVEWRITSGSPEHGHDQVVEKQDQGCAYHLGRLRCTLASFSDHSAKSTYRALVIQSKPPETQAVHESGALESSNIKVCAAVDASEAPSLSTFINGAMGGVGIADPIAELAGGMILKLGKPEGCTKLGVTYHIQKSYKAFWQDQGAVWSGVVCSLDQPFTIMVLTQGRDLEMPFKFTPTNAQVGTVSFDVTKYGTHWEGNGPYAVQGSGTEKLSLVGTIVGSYKTNAGQGSYPVHFDIPLTPLDTNECSQR
jgi:hypothetical protein